MGRTKDGIFWCDYCGREIGFDPILDGKWCFHSEFCKTQKYKLIAKAESDFENYKPKRSLYAVNQEEDE